MALALSLNIKFDPVVSTFVANVIFIFIGLFWLSKNEMLGVKVRVDGRFILILTALSILFWYVVSGFSMNFANFTQDGSLKKYLKISKTSKELFVILSVFIAPVLEEVLLRGVLFGGYVKKNRFFAYFSSIVMFVVLHGTLTHVFLSLFMGLFFCLLYEISENIKYCIFSHFIFNLCSFLGGKLILYGVVWFFIYGVLYILLFGVLLSLVVKRGLFTWE